MHCGTGIKKPLFSKTTPYKKVNCRGLRGITNKGFRVYQGIRFTKGIVKIGRFNAKYSALVKVVVDKEGLLYSNWLPLTTKNNTGLISLINTFRGIFRTKGITIICPPTTGTALFLQIPNFLKPGIALQGS